MTKRSLQVGDRVRVYREGSSPKGTALESCALFHPSGWFCVQLDDGVKIRPHIRQCRRLIRKPKPQKERGEMMWVGDTNMEPFKTLSTKQKDSRHERGERAERWMNIANIGFGHNQFFTTENEARAHAVQNYPQCTTTVRLLEVSENEVPVSREMFQKSWAECFGSGNIFQGAEERLAKSLGFPEQGEIYA